MFDILSLIIISIFIPAIIVGGTKLYKCNNIQKVIKIFAIIFFALELFRFFYNARFYPDAKTYAPNLKFSYIAVYVIMMLFAAFNNGKLGEFFKKAVILTSLIPLVLGLFNPTIYTNELDVNSVLKACYFVECGLAIALSILVYKNSNITTKKLDILWGFLVACGYVFVNFLSITFWNSSTQLNLIWYIQMLTSIASVLAVALIHHLICKKTSKQKIETTENKE